MDVFASAAMGANIRAASPDSPALSSFARGRGIPPGVGEMRMASFPSSISAPRTAAISSADVVSSLSLIPCIIEGESARRAAAMNRALRLFEGGAETSPDSVLGVTRRII